MTLARGRGSASLVCSEGGRPTADMDLAAGDACAAVELVGVPVLRENSGDAGRQEEAETIVRRFEEEAGLSKYGSKSGSFKRCAHESGEQGRN